MSQVFAVRQVCEKYLEKRKQVFWPFMDLEKKYYIIDGEGLWSILRLCEVGGTSKGSAIFLCELEDV